MKIAITDACIFIDLIELNVISDFFRLELEIHTTVDVVNELFPNQKEILIAYQAGSKLTIHNLTPEDIKKVEAMNLSKGLSPPDRSVLFMASTIEDVIVLSSDGLVRKSAGKLAIEYHGLLWIIDQLVEQKIISSITGASKLNELLKTNIIYNHPKTKKEIERRIVKWK